MAKRKQDKVRVLRVVEYVGDRNAVESEVTRAIHGERVIEGRDGTVLIKAATLGYPIARREPPAQPRLRGQRRYLRATL